jgi:hypothetical protein
MVHQIRSSLVGGKKTSSILLALHEPIRVPPVIFVLPKISPADAVLRTDATTTGVSAPKLVGVTWAAFGTISFRKTSRLVCVVQWHDAPMHHFSTWMCDLTASPSARRCISRPDEDAVFGFGALALEALELEKPKTALFVAALGALALAALELETASSMAALGAHRRPTALSFGTA